MNLIFISLGVYITKKVISLKRIIRKNILKLEINYLRN